MLKRTQSIQLPPEEQNTTHPAAHGQECGILGGF